MLLDTWASLGRYKRRRRRRSVFFDVIAILLCLLVVQAQQNGDNDDNNIDNNNRQSRSTSASSSSTTTTTIPAATSTLVNMVESMEYQATLDVNSPSPAQFYLAAPFKNSSNPLYVSASLCSGPAIPPFNVTDSNVLSELSLSSYEASLVTLPHMYVSTDQANQKPGPNDQTGKPDIQYLLGGFAQDENTDQDPDGAWITIWPPTETRNVTGSWTLSIIASTEGSPLQLENKPGLILADSDRDSALLTTNYNFTLGSYAHNLTLYVLPTSGPGSLQDDGYFNSSVCAISTAFANYNISSNRDQPRINSSETTRGITNLTPDINQRRLQFEVDNLDPGTNFTAWLVEYGQLGASTTINASIYPAVKFVTKISDNCRLVYDVDFCPQVAYSIPVSPDISTERALDIINATVSTNFNNFTATMSTFPCNSSDFGEYSPVQRCSYCTRQYQDWLCAVTMPRCVDPLPDSSTNNSAATPDPLTLNGMETAINPGLLPYIINRNNNSRQSYIDAPDGLDAGIYGELLPCIYTCYFVSRTCPMPLIQWSCPVWDISAQSDYGTFADFSSGLGAGTNGQDWGGPSRYIAQDGFGNLYCNSMGTDQLLLELNGAMASRPSIISLLPSLVTSVLLWYAFF